VSDEASDLALDREALCRTRTGDPFLTMDGARRNTCSRQATEGARERGDLAQRGAQLGAGAGSCCDTAGRARDAASPPGAPTRSPPGRPRRRRSGRRRAVPGRLLEAALGLYQQPPFINRAARAALHLLADLGDHALLDGQRGAPHPGPIITSDPIACHTQSRGTTEGR
jgi:hypothetical protein